MVYRRRRMIEDRLLNVLCRIRQQAMVGKVALPLDMRIPPGLCRTIFRVEYVLHRTLRSDG